MRRFLRRIWHLLRRNQFEADLTEELEFHRSMKEQQLHEQGLDAGSAQLAIRRQLGSILLAKDCARDVWVWRWLQSVAQDARFAVRLLVKDPWFALVVVVVLGIGIALTNAMFTMLNAALFRGLPIDDARIVALSTRDALGRESGVSLPDCRDWQEATHAFAGTAALQRPVGQRSLREGDPILLDGFAGLLRDYLSRQHAAVLLDDFDRCQVVGVDSEPHALQAVAASLWQHEA